MRDRRLERIPGGQNRRARAPLPVRPPDRVTRDAADDTEIELRHVLESERLAMLHESLRGGGNLEVQPFAASLSGSMRR